MAKLQKSQKQKQRYSLHTPHAVSKLSPEEIRLLTNSVPRFHNDQAQPPSFNLPRQSTPDVTPPLTPETDAYNLSTVQRGHELTPPHSPGENCPATPNGNPDYRQTHGSAQVPIPANTGKEAERKSSTPVSNIDASRTGVVLHRGSGLSEFPSVVPTPLPFAQFSKLGRSRTSSFVEDLDQQYEVGGDTTHPLTKKRSQSFPSASIAPTDTKFAEPTSQVTSRRSSATTVELTKMQSRTFLGPRDLMRMQSEQEVSASFAEFARLSAQTQRQAQRQARKSMPPQSYHRADTTTSQQPRRASLLTSLKPTGLISIPYEDTKVGVEPKMKTSLRDYLPSTKASNNDQQKKADQIRSQSVSKPTTSFDQVDAIKDNGVPSVQSPEETKEALHEEMTEKPISVMDIHPALRPQPEPVSDNATPSFEPRVNTRVTDLTTPSYAKCNHCGKLRKVPTHQSELSPVQESQYARSDRIKTSTPPPLNLTGSPASSRADISPYYSGLECAGKHHDDSHEVADFINNSGDIIATRSVPAAMTNRRIVAKELVRFPSLHFDAISASTPYVLDGRTGDGARSEATLPKPSRFRSLRDEDGVQTTILEGRVPANSTLPASSRNDSGSSDGHPQTLPFHNSHPFYSGVSRPESRGRPLQRDTTPSDAPSGSVTQRRRMPGERVRFDESTTQKPDKEFAALLPGGRPKPMSALSPPTLTQPQTQTQAQLPTLAKAQPQSTNYPPSAFGPRMRMNFTPSSTSEETRNSNRRSTSSSKSQSSESTRGSISESRRQSQSPSTRQRGVLTVSPAVVEPGRKRTSSISLSTSTVANALRSYIKPRSASIDRTAKKASETPDYSLNISRSNPRSRESTSRVREQSQSRHGSRRPSVVKVDMQPRSLADIFAPPNPPFLAEAKLKG